MASRLQRRLKPIASGVALAIILSASLTAAANPAAAGKGADNGPADLPGVSAADTENMIRQQPLVAAADIVREEVERRGLIAQYAGIVLRDSHVDLYWKGKTPAALRRAVDVASRTAPVRIHSAAYSIVELRLASQLIEERWTGGRENLHAIKLQPDGSGLIVSAPPSSARQNRLADVGVPITMVNEGPTVRSSPSDDAARAPQPKEARAPQPKAMAAPSRLADTPPWAGGAVISGPTGNCTAGFGVRNSAGAVYIVTAAHCGYPEQEFYNGLRNRFIGRMGPYQQTLDIALIPTSTVLSQIYVGTTTDFRLMPVNGWGHTYVGEYLCQSGYYSAQATGGHVCNLKVTHFRTTVDEMVEARHQGGLIASRSGDSGAPVYSICANRVCAKGVDSGHQMYDESILAFQDFATVNRVFHVYPRTS